MKPTKFIQWPLPFALLTCFLLSTNVYAQNAPDTILYNGKIITVDDPSFTPSAGTIAQAIAIRGGRIAAVGNNGQIRSLAGPNTKSTDLKGRAVVPGIVDTHDHPMDWEPVNPYVVKKAVSDDVVVVRFLDGSPDEQVRKFIPTLDEAVHKAKPGQWIRIILLLGRQLEWVEPTQALIGKRITKQQLDMAAPNNPVEVRSAHVATMFNSKGIEEIKKVWDFSKTPFQNSLNEETGEGGTVYRIVEPDVILKDRMDIIKEIYRLGLSWWTGYGITTVGTLFYAPSAVTAFRELGHEQKLATRIAWGWNWGQDKFYTDPYFLADIAARVGEGSDNIWFIGGSAGSGGACSTLPGTSPEVKAREGRCTYEPGSTAANVMYQYVKAGGRLAIFHTVADKDIDYALDIIEKASKEAGFTLDEIRNKRHAYDHTALSPRPDQVERLARLGMLVGGTNLRIYTDSPGRFKDYGERGVQMVVPRKSLTSGGVMNTFEIDRALGYNDITAFWVLAKPINRVSVDGKVYSPNQRIDRVTALKSATTWGSYYVLREKDLGSLEAGKLADLLVLDRDYLTIPEDDIAKIRVLMTMVGGKVVHLVPSLAREWGVSSAGAQVELGGPAAQW